MANVIHPPVIIEPAIVPCCSIAGGSVYLEHGILYFTGWELVPSPCGRLEHRIVTRTATPLDVARVLIRDATKLLTGGAH